MQNWAEVIERDFLVLEETLRLVGEGEERVREGERREGWVTDSEGSWSGSGRSESGSEVGDGVGEEGMVDEEGDTDMLAVGETKAKGKEHGVHESVNTVGDFSNPVKCLNSPVEQSSAATTAAGADT